MSETTNKAMHGPLAEFGNALAHIGTCDNCKKHPHFIFFMRSLFDLFGKDDNHKCGGKRCKVCNG